MLKIELGELNQRELLVLCDLIWSTRLDVFKINDALEIHLDVDRWFIVGPFRTLSNDLSNHAVFCRVGGLPHDEYAESQEPIRGSGELYVFVMQFLKDVLEL